MLQRVVRSTVIDAPIELASKKQIRDNDANRNLPDQQVSFASDGSRKLAFVTVHELTKWALANGWQMIDGHPSLTKPSKRETAIVRLVMKATVASLEIKKPSGKWDKISTASYSKISQDSETDTPSSRTPKAGGSKGRSRSRLTASSSSRGFTELPVERLRLIGRHFGCGQFDAVFLQ